MYIHMALPTSSPSFPRFGQCEFLEIDEDELDTSSLHARLVKPPTRRISLPGQSPGTKSPSDTTIDVGTLLSDLNRLAPSVAKEFVPKNHATSTFTFRLINDVDFHGEEDGYIAMSYCWKRVTPNIPRRVVTPVGDLPFGWTKEIEQFPLPTSSAIFQAVLRERRIGEGLWFDQVCINEEDKTETATTIGAIDIIYQNARTVVVVLDDVTATPDEEQFLRYYVEDYSYSELPPEQQPNIGMSPPYMQQYSSFQSFFERVISSAWFERAWCAHEMKMGQAHVFLVPCYNLYEDEVQTVIRFTGTFFLHMLVLASEFVTTASPHYAKTLSLQKFFHERVNTAEGSLLAVQRPDTPQTQFSQPMSMIPTIAEIFQMKAGGNPRLPEYLRRLDANRDKTCIALNASGVPLSLAPTSPFSRPNIEDECLRSLLLVGLAARDPVSLCTTGTPLQLHDGSISWLFRPTSLDVNPARPSPMRFSKRASHITQSSDDRAEYVQLDLIFLDLPHRSQPNPLFPTHVVRSRTFVDLCIQYQIQGPGLWSFWQTPNHPRSAALRNIFIQTLACVFDCGAQWVHDISSDLQQTQLPAMDTYAIEMLLNPHLIIQNYILLAEGQTALSSLLNFVSTLILSGVPWASGASERTHGPLIISAPISSSPFDNFTTPVYGGKAVIFAPFQHSKTLLIAVPDAVKDARYNPLARGWILTSMNPYTGSLKPTVSWTLQSKGVIFGDGHFNAGLARCGEADIRNHRVYGPSTR
ncbi:heterokaryon incompatibility protein-domain-containing protein [Pyrenochaeta sp. MPI-SDFR-AT-0127]|nr:heterokaryon incompatibility protein-domain-containing protein [Pyrenochaeta sp. MPI-SDFR-AT-0127]